MLQVFYKNSEQDTRSFSFTTFLKPEGITISSRCQNRNAGSPQPNFFEIKPKWNEQFKIISFLFPQNKKTRNQIKQTKDKWFSISYCNVVMLSLEHNNFMFHPCAHGLQYHYRKSIVSNFYLYERKNTAIYSAIVTLNISC